ncbi:hypothetical protein ABZP36_007118 [Zizania latifolia]
MAFARAVLSWLEPPGSGIGLVPCAVGGTAIREWVRREPLNDQMLRRAHAVAECGEIEAVLWYQGESDAATAAYGGNLERLIANIRADLMMPQLPFIQVALASGNRKNIEKVRKAQLGINLPNVVTVDAIGLSLNEDNLHLTTESQDMMDLFCTMENYATMEEDNMRRAKQETLVQATDPATPSTIPINDPSTQRPWKKFHKDKPRHVYNVEEQAKLANQGRRGHGQGRHRGPPREKNKKVLRLPRRRVPSFWPKCSACSEDR